MKKHSFIIELLKSPPFLLFLILAFLITIGVIIANHKNVVKMKEEVIYVHPEIKK